MKPPRGLSDDEAALWARVAETVDPLKPRQPRVATGVQAPMPLSPVPPRAARPNRPAKPASDGVRPPRRSSTGGGLDASWERKLAKAGIEPDFTLDLHGHTLDQAYHRLDRGMRQAKAMGARLVLVVTGKARPVDPADRGRARGAIRAKILDWLAAGDHGADIAAVRKAHRRHGGEGALYLVLRR